QRIKNWQTKTANSIKKLQSRYAFVLTGTPIENRIDEIYSIVQFLDPSIFGPLFRFNRDFYKLDSNGMAIGYKNMNLLHTRLQSIMLRRKKSEVEGELPQRVDKTYFVTMSQSQQDRYDEYETMVSRLAAKAKKYPLSFDEMKRLQAGLACMRMLCDSAYILDQKIAISPKVNEVVPIIEELLEDKSSKIIIFSEWEKMLQLLNFSLEKKSIHAVWHTGSLNQLQRREEIKKFKEDATCNIFLSTDSGSVGLNLQVANVVINLDMPWNPAKLEQRIARAWRKHQKRTVQVINLVTEDRLEHRIVEIVRQKQFLSDNVLDGLGQDELKLPSSRKEFLEDLEKIVPSDKTEKLHQENRQKFNPQHFTQDILSQFSDRIELVSHNTNNNSLLIVVDKKDESIQSKIVKDAPIKLLDKQEYAFLNSLAQQGLIEIKEDLEVLYSQNREKKETIDEETVKKIKELFQPVKRSYDMATLLHGGGFIDESLAIFIKMVQNSFELLNLLKDDGFDKEFIDNIKAENELESSNVVAQSDKFYARLKKIVSSL
ncbi:MAG: DEAD/DEAH box helicase, partial [Campylobacterota bacterium]|nr:DEAD/DEAH box helicase [Campylobacterota bacterium]